MLTGSEQRRAQLYVAAAVGVLEDAAQRFNEALLSARVLPAEHRSYRDRLYAALHHARWYISPHAYPSEQEAMQYGMACWNIDEYHVLLPDGTLQQALCPECGTHCEIRSAARAGFQIQPHGCPRRALEPEPEHVQAASERDLALYTGAVREVFTNLQTCALGGQGLIDAVHQRWNDDSIDGESDALYCYTHQCVWRIDAVVAQARLLLCAFDSDHPTMAHLEDAASRNLDPYHVYMYDACIEQIQCIQCMGHIGLACTALGNGLQKISCECATPTFSRECVDVNSYALAQTPAHAHTWQPVRRIW